ncbi:MAG: ThiF family adenylyltransferase, partial [Sphingomonadales bacterium]|nr:ThiF family adenylyltransferase [Sphingomonadales bacterium]
MTLTDTQLERYARHIVLKEIGGAGQRRLLEATVAIVGAGGIGSPVIQYLAAAGVGRLRIVDDDQVALSNLQRQTLYGTDTVGMPKTAEAARAVARLNPDVAVGLMARRLDADTVEEFLAGA